MYRTTNACIWSLPRTVSVLRKDLSSTALTDIHVAVLNTCVYWKSKDDPDTSLEDSLPDGMSTSDVPTKYVDGIEYVHLRLLRCAL